jgi:hypothetical protein
MTEGNTSNPDPDVPTDNAVENHPLSLNDSARTAAATPVRVHETIWTDGFTSSVKN